MCWQSLPVSVMDPWRLTPPGFFIIINSQLCGICKDECGEIHGTYTAEGVTKLCEWLKGSAVTSLNCAAALRVLYACLPFCQRPLTQKQTNES